MSEKYTNQVEVNLTVKYNYIDTFTQDFLIIIKL